MKNFLFKFFYMKNHSYVFFLKMHNIYDLIRQKYCAFLLKFMGLGVWYVGSNSVSL